MKPAFGVFEKLLFVAVPIAASSTIATLPAYAATFASSESGLSLTQFAVPVGVLVDTDTNASTVATGFGTVTADADAKAELFPEKGFTSSFSETEGTGLGYTGEALSRTFLAGRFELGQNSVFEFDFFANLKTSIDQSGLEFAAAETAISYNLFNVATGELLDRFSLLMSLDSPGTFKVSNLNASQYFTTSFNSVPGNAGSTSIAQLTGFYSRTFSQPINLELQAFNANRATVQSVPTPAMLPGLLITSVWLPFVKRKREKAQQLATQEIEA